MADFYGWFLFDIVDYFLSNFLDHNKSSKNDEYSKPAGKDIKAWYNETYSGSGKTVNISKIPLSMQRSVRIDDSADFGVSLAVGKGYRQEPQT